MGVVKFSFGKTDKGEKVTVYRLENSKGMAAEIIDYGAILKSLYVPDSNGNVIDVVLGFDDIKSYQKNPSFFGSTIGRNANRIAQAEFTLNRKTYILEKNDNKRNNLHSSFDGCFNKKMFKGQVLKGENAVCLELDSPDMDQGFPGNLKAKVIYRLTEENALEIEYFAVSDQDTVYNPTNHSYFNLSGHASGSAMDHVLMINAKKYTPADKESIPFGKIAPVKGTPFDFTKPRVIGDRINEDFEQLNFAGGYDHNFCLEVQDEKPFLAASLKDEKTGRVMTVYTDLPGLQFYAGNFIKKQIGKGGAPYKKRCGICLETQYFPNSINEKKFESPVLKAGEEFHSITRFVFS